MRAQRITQDKDGLQPISFTDGGKTQTVTYTWFRGDHCNYGPTLSHLESWEGIRDYFATGFAPERPVINTGTRITAFGSCFAANISAWLTARNYRVLSKDSSSRAYVVRMGEGMVNTYSIRQQFEWAFEDKQPSVELWHGYDAKAFGYDPEIQAETRQLFLNTEVFVLTLGLSEVWYDKKTEEVFWRAVPAAHYDRDRHGFRAVSVQENFENLSAIVGLIRKHAPKAKVIFTLSPIPLVATFRPIACTSANAISKASLRMAIDRMISEQNGDGALFYWPSYEIVMEAFPKPWKADRRHVKRPVLDFIMTLFERIWCTEAISDQEMAGRMLAALAATGGIRRSSYKKLLAMNGEERAEFARKLEVRGRGSLAQTIHAI